MNKLSTIKGFADHLPREAAQYARLCEAAGRVFSAYGYREIHVPVLEYTELFARSIGTETDVVQKEMFTMQDRKDRSLTLRPEATAGIMRAYIEHAVHAQESQSKYFTYGPMFRYERPQKGRMRQFHQIDCELLGVHEPQADAEMILMLMEYLDVIGLPDITLELNTLGCKKCRPAYRELLRDWLRAKPVKQFCEDCRRRMDTNPMRVLDCKVPSCKELTEGAPSIGDHVCEECSDHFAVVRSILDGQGLPYRLNSRLVRGLDYYMRTTFEAVSGNIGSQSSVAGGGRYDGLIASLGGPEVPGIGFACGMERLVMLMPEQDLDRPDFYVAVLDASGVDAALHLAQSLRKAGYRGESAYAAGSLKSQLRQADRRKARYCLILGGNELENGTVLIKNLDTGEQAEADRSAAPDLEQI